MEQDHNVQALISSMREQVESEKATILDDARTEVEKIRVRADAEIAKLKAEAEKQLERDISGEKGKILGEIRLKKRDRLLEVKEKAVGEAFDQARGKLLELCRDDGHQEAVKSLIAEAIEETGDCGEVLVAPEDESLCRSLVAAVGCSCTVKTSESGPCVVIAKSSDGRKTVDNSILTRLDKVKSGMVHEVARALFDEGEQAGLS